MLTDYFAIASANSFHNRLLSKNLIRDEYCLNFDLFDLILCVFSPRFSPAPSAVALPVLRRIFARPLTRRVPSGFACALRPSNPDHNAIWWGQLEYQKVKRIC